MVGDVTIGKRCYVDYNVVIESSNEPVSIGDETIILANSVIRSVGGKTRPGFPIIIGNRTLIGPQCTLAGCSVGSNCYIATAVMIFQGAMIGDNSRISAGAIVHLKTCLPANSHIGLRHLAVAKGDGYLATTDVTQARDAISHADFFNTVFEEDSHAKNLHSEVIERMLQEVTSWTDVPV